MSATTAHEVKTVAERAQQPAEYQAAVQKIVISHAVNELYGAQVFDEPAIQLAPTPYAKWLTCRIAMEEYHHHVRFRALADEIGILAERMDTRNKRSLAIFEFKLQTWPAFCVIRWPSCSCPGCWRWTSLPGTSCCKGSSAWSSAESGWPC